MLGKNPFCRSRAVPCVRADKGYLSKGIVVLKSEPGEGIKLPSTSGGEIVALGRTAKVDVCDVFCEWKILLIIC